MSSIEYPVRWTRFGRASSFVAKHLKTLAPPILIVSLPRSGSSWVGEVSGNASNALYLREPLNQTFLAAGGRTSVFEVDPNNTPKVYREAAVKAFSGFPIFADDIVMIPDQWKLSNRWRRRLVIKEVNPLACTWLLQYKPRIVLLIRHPAAVALSYRKLGWWDAEEGGWEDDGCWKIHGAYQSTVLHKAFTSLLTYRDLRIIRYEDLCDKPLMIFRELYDFAELEWDKKTEDFISERSSGGDDSDPYGTSRNSRRMIRAWQGMLTNRDLEELRKGYSLFNLPWYISDDDW